MSNFMACSNPLSELPSWDRESSSSIRHTSGNAAELHSRAEKLCLYSEMVESVKQSWRMADCVCLDVDSTVVIDEGIDKLADFLGKGDEVAAITVGAMQGAVSYKSSLKKRLDIIKPTHEQICRFIALNPPILTPNVDKLVDVLHQKNVPVYLISGGFRCLIEPVAAALHIPPENIFSNELLFYFNGNYAGFDEQQPTCNGDGKAIVIQQLKDSHRYERVVHIGDGVTDLEACPPADAFIGFGGNQVRESVQQRSQWFVSSFADLISELM